eukprot:TRINITY_DN56030_c0_g1_i1.p1 TRINITY_DN56030_c0_g1~~TRINITY_DN56030_c0_g1_i1.p1  ORF type:complete len:575 (+),score=90.68 TRINITY_DN56030_c0_g1_i1:265-1989(+)
MDGLSRGPCQATTHTMLKDTLTGSQPTSDSQSQGMELAAAHSQEVATDVKVCKRRACCYGTLASRPLLQQSATIPETRSLHRVGLGGSAWRSLRRAAVTEDRLLKELYEILQGLPASCRHEQIKDALSRSEKEVLAAWAAVHRQRANHTPRPATMNPAEQHGESPVEPAAATQAATMRAAGEAPLDSSVPASDLGACDAVPRCIKPRTHLGRVACRPSRSTGRKRHWSAGSTSYQASICVNALVLIAPEVPDLQTSKSHLAVLEAIRRSIGPTMAAPQGNAQTKITEKVAAAMADHGGVTPEELGLRYHVQLSTRQWVNTTLHTTTTGSLEAATKAWCRLAALRWTGLRRPASLEEAWGQWQALRREYVAVLEDEGQNRAKTEQRLDALEASSREYRERRFAKKSPEATADSGRSLHYARRGKRRSAFDLKRQELRRQRRVERERLRRERQAYAAEDARGKAMRRLESRLQQQTERHTAIQKRQVQAQQQRAEAKAVSRLKWLLARWRRTRRTWADVLAAACRRCNNSAQVHLAATPLRKRAAPPASMLQRDAKKLRSTVHYGGVLLDAMQILQ